MTESADLERLRREFERVLLDQHAETTVLKVWLQLLTVFYCTQNPNPLGVLKTLRDEVLFALPTSGGLPENPQLREVFLKRLDDRAKALFVALETGMQAPKDDPASH